jgi:threonine aldolase
MIELRSDTFTVPTPAMVQSIVDAELGDDVYGEDPTVSQLEKLAAEVMGKEAACLMPSGTMANLSSIMAQVPRGAKILVGTEADIYVYEAGGASVCGGVVYHPVPNQPDGRILLSDLENAFPDDPEDPQFPLPRLICLENTHNRCGGAILPLAYLREVREFADRQQLPVHLDGARVFNAAVGLDVPVAEIAHYADSVQFCLSKGLSAPIGSVVVGTAGFIRTVRRIRKMLGGGMRQAGIIAAPGILAIKDFGRLAIDHRHAARLAEGLRQIKGIELDPGTVHTNIVIFRVTDKRFTWQRFAAAVGQLGLALTEAGHGRLRAVTHSGICSEQVEQAITIIAQVLDLGSTRF